MPSRSPRRDAGKLDLPYWNEASLTEIRGALEMPARHSNGFERSFGRKGEVDPIHRPIGTAAGRGDNPVNDATYAGAAGKERRQGDLQTRRAGRCVLVG
jgi:hypothetical protein